MVREEFDAALTVFGTKKQPEGFVSFQDGSHLTMHIAHSGSSLSVQKVEALKLQQNLIIARTAKKELFVVPMDRVVAMALDISEGAAARRPAGFL